MQKITSTTIIKKGDIVRSAGRRKVIEVLGEIYFLSILECYDRFDSIYTIEDLIYFDYYLDTPVWSPKDLKKRDEYWYIGSRGDIWKSSWKESIDDLIRLRSDNIFETEESAEARLKEILER